MSTSRFPVLPVSVLLTVFEWKAMLSFLPLIDMDRQFLGRESRLWNDYITRSSSDDYWKPISMRDGDKWGPSGPGPAMLRWSR